MDHLSDRENTKNVANDEPATVIHDNLVDTRAAGEGDNDPHPDGDTGPHSELAEPVVAEDNVPLNSEVDGESAPIDNGDSSPHTEHVVEEGSS